MRKTFAILVIAVLAAACGSTATGPIIGKWEFEKIEINKPKAKEIALAGSDSTGSNADSLAAVLTNIDEEMQTLLMRGCIYEFNADGKCNIIIMNFPDEGNYTLSSDLKKLTMTRKIGKTESFDVVKLDDKELDLKSTDGKLFHFLKK